MLLLGFKIYKTWVIILVPFLIAVVGFQLYMSFIEKSEQSQSKFILYICICVLVVIIVGALLVYFTNLAYFVLAFIVSIMLGKYLF